jgi:hypothetical protein
VTNELQKLRTLGKSMLRTASMAYEVEKLFATVKPRVQTKVPPK